MHTNHLGKILDDYKNMKHTLILLFILPMLVFGQNKTDKKGQKQGAWEMKYEKSEIVRYKGTFKDDKPVGEFVHYYPNGKVKAISNHIANTNVSRTKMYDTEGKLIAFGKYVNQEKDSTWTYYGANGSVTSREDYKLGKRHGKKLVYFSDNKLYEKMTYEKGVEQGVWAVYHANGKTRVTCNFKDGNMDGKITYYYENGTLETEGFYRNAVQNGFWRFYDTRGRIEKEAFYKNGEVILEGDDITDELKKLKEEGKL